MKYLVIFRRYRSLIKLRKLVVIFKFGIGDNDRRAFFCTHFSEFFEYSPVLKHFLHVCERVHVRNDYVSFKYVHERARYFENVRLYLFYFVR